MKNKNLWIGVGVAAGVVGLGGAGWWALNRGKVKVHNYTDTNWWNHGVGRAAPAVMLEVPPEQVQPGDTVVFPDTGEERTVTRVQGSQLGGSEVFLEGAARGPLPPGSSVRLKKAAA